MATKKVKVKPVVFDKEYFRFKVTDISEAIDFVIAHTPAHCKASIAALKAAQYSLLASLFKFD